MDGSGTRLRVLVEVLADDGEIIDVLDPDISCGGHFPGDLCGGCDMCLLMQAQYYGYKLRDVPAEKYEQVETNRTKLSLRHS